MRLSNSSGSNHPSTVVLIFTLPSSRPVQIQVESLWVSDWTNFGESPVLSVEAKCNTCGNPNGPAFNGAFRWDWAVPFDDYGVDAYGQITFTNSYGIGGNAEGAAMGSVAVPEGTEINGIGVTGDASVQAKGFVNSDYLVQTQYQVMLYEWDIFVSGTADTMAWDMFLNLEEREEQQAYHEYFLPLQVEEVKPLSSMKSMSLALLITV